MVNVILQRSAGFLMSDGGMWDSEGRLIELVDKVVALPRFRAALVSRGGNMPPSWSGWDAVTSLQDLLAKLPEYARAIKGKKAGLFPGGHPHLHSVEVTVMFWDDVAGKPRAVQMSTADTGHTDGYAAVLDSQEQYRPYAWFDLPGLCLAPTLNWEDASMGDLDHVENERHFDVRKHAPAIVKAQRATITDVGGHMIRTVEGWVDMAVVTAEGVTVERVAEWPTDVPREQPGTA